MRPPSTARRILAALLPMSDRHAVDDLDELYLLRIARDGAGAARRWYWGQCMAFPARLAWYRATAGLGGRAGGWTPAPDGSLHDEADTTPLVASIIADLRLARRRLLRRPAYAVAAVLTVGIGVAAITSVYSIANWMLLRPVPAVTRPAELATILLEAKGAPFGLPISNPDMVELTQHVPSAHGLAAYTAQDLHLAVDPGSSPIRTTGEIVTPAYFATLGVSMAVGRAFDSINGGPAGGNVAVISHHLWLQHWNGSPAVIGRRVTLNGEAFTVIGVAPKGFHGAELPGRSEVWVPAGAVAALLHDPRVLTTPEQQVWQVLIARIPTLEGQGRAAAELDRAVATIRGRKGASSFMATGWTFKVHPGIGLSPLLRDAVGHTLFLLMAAAALFLLLTCANVSNLGLTRAMSLSSTTAVHRLLGASLGRVVRERLIESGVVGLTGALVGVVLAIGATSLVRGAGIAGVPLDYTGLLLDVRVILITAGAAIGAGMLAGVIPALSAGKWDGASLVRIGRLRDKRSRRIRHGLVVAQVALSTILVVGSGLLGRTLSNLRHIDLGFAPTNLLTFALDPELQGYDDQRTATLIDGLLRSLGEHNQVVSASITQTPALFKPSYIPSVFDRPGRTNPEDHVVAHTMRVSPSFFDAFGLSLTGENFRAESWLVRDSTAERVAILNEAAARQLFPGVVPQSVVGSFVYPAGDRRKPARVVGVVRDARLNNVVAPSDPYIFRPWSQGFRGTQFTVYIRTKVPPQQLMAFARETVRRIDPTLPVYDLHSVESEIDDLFAEQRLVSSLAALLGLAGLVLSALGLYSLLAQAVLERRREIGIRCALGALPRAVVATVVRSGLIMTVSGLLIGLAGAAYLSRFLASRLFGIAPIDPVTYLGGAFVLLIAALIASGVPARRASRVEIVEALRED